MNQKKVKSLRSLLKLKMEEDKQRFITKSAYNRLKIKRHQDTLALRNWITGMNAVKRNYKSLNSIGREGFADEWS